MLKEEKVKQVEELAQKAQESGAVVLSDYRGLSVAELAELRGKLSALGADFQVVKNTILKRALEKAALSLPGELTGPTGVLFSQSADPLESLKTLVTLLKEKGKGEVKLGFLDATGAASNSRSARFEKARMAAEELLSLAALPGRKVLEAQLVFQLLSPIHKLSDVLRSPGQRFISVLSQVAGHVVRERRGRDEGR